MVKRDNSKDKTSELSNNQPKTIQGFGPFDLGFDISTTTTGVVLLNHHDGSLVHMSAIRMNTVEGLFDKADYALEYLRNLQIQPGAIARVFVEANAKRFAQGLTSADTILTLAKINGLVSYLAHKEFNAPVLDVLPVTARSRLGFKVSGKNQKEQVFQQNMAMHPDFPWITHQVKGLTVVDKINRDMNDAWVICRGGQLIHPYL